MRATQLNSGKAVEKHLLLNFHPDEQHNLGGPHSRAMTMLKLSEF
jgi:hypothetical protein